MLCIGQVYLAPDKSRAQEADLPVADDIVRML
jgi:hypothetical protein